MSSRSSHKIMRPAWPGLSFAHCFILPMFVIKFPPYSVHKIPYTHPPYSDGEWTPHKHLGVIYLSCKGDIRKGWDIHSSTSTHVALGLYGHLPHSKQRKCGLAPPHSSRRLHVFALSQSTFAHCLLILSLYPRAVFVPDATLVLLARVEVLGQLLDTARQSQGVHLVEVL